MRTIVALSLVLGLVGGWSGDAEARYGTIAGSWIIDVTPRPAEPEFPDAPPPFVSIFNFELARTVTETDGALNPNSVVAPFPPDVFPPFSASDGYGAWQRSGHNRFKCTFLKILFDKDGVQIGFVRNTLSIVLTRHGRLEGEGISSFIEGSDPDGEAFFSGPFMLEGSRLKVVDDNVDFVSGF